MARFACFNEKTERLAASGLTDHNEVLIKVQQVVTGFGPIQFDWINLKSAAQDSGQTAVRPVESVPHSDTQRNERHVHV
jgi:hypothetical protein